MIDLQDIGKRYVGRNFDVPALRCLSLAIPDGQYASVMGKSGSGKSTLMKIIGLLDFDYEGRYRLGGEEYRGLGDAAVSRARRQIGYVFQDFQLIQRYTVRRNLELAMVIRSGTFSAEAIDRCLDEVGLADKARSFPDELSGGQKQRVAIARAVLADPRLIVADEPTGALDSGTAFSILSLIAEVHERHRCTVVVVTHDPDVAARAHRTIELVTGEVSRDVLH